MDLRRLRVFLVLAEELHFGRTAQRLGVAQPAVSQSLRALEEEVGAPLLVRNRRGAALTEAGARFVPAARAALDALSRGVHEARSVAAGELGVLRLAFTPAAILGRPAAALRRFRARYPAITLQAASLSTQELVSSLLAGQSDLGISVLPGEVDGLVVVPLSAEPLVAALPARHPLAREERVPLRALLEEHFFVTPRAHEPGIYDAYVRLCEATQSARRDHSEVNQLDTVLSFISSGFGVSLLPGSVRQVSFPGVSYRDTRPRVQVRRAALYVPKGLPLAGEHLLTLLRPASASPRARVSARRVPQD